MEILKEEKSLNVTGSEDLKAKVNDVEVFGNPDTWLLIAKASSKSQGWMKSTKAMEIVGCGVVIQVSTQQGDNVSEALTFVPGATIASKVIDEKGTQLRMVVYGNNLKVTIN